jgi:hypothetical protein
MVAVCVSAVALMTGCLSPMGLQTALIGDVGLPGMATDNVSGRKIGYAKARNIFGIIADGDCSIHAAAKNGGITKISTVDYQVKNVLWGAFAECTTIVTGE